jgi:hypothetical protein
MPLYKYVWDDGSVTVVEGDDEEDAQGRLEDVYGDIEEDRLTLVKHFITTFQLVNFADDKEGQEPEAWEVSFDDPTEEMLSKAAAKIEDDDEEEEALDESLN